MVFCCLLEHNGPDSLLYCTSLPGAFTRGAIPEEALAKMPDEIRSFMRWLREETPEGIEVKIIREIESDLNIRDADSDVIFESEMHKLTWEEYLDLKSMAMKSAADFQLLFDAVSNKDRSCLPERKTFYGPVPRTAREMYEHTKNVNEYYFWEIGVDTDNAGTIAECRERGFQRLERIAGFLEKEAAEGSYGELWSLRKVLRRFIWHDRIHAKAMYRMATKTFGKDCVPDIFRFEI